jgi:hypothetical protein
MKKLLFLTIVSIVLSGAHLCGLAQTLNVPNLITPGNGATQQATNTTLDWGTSTGATTYELRYGLDPLMGSFNFQSLTSSQFTTSQLLFGTTYYWQVRAKSATDSSNWSPIWSFTVTDTVILVSPGNGQGFLSPDALLDWSAVSGISGYQVQLDTSSSFNSSLSQIITTGTTSQAITSNLRFGTRYFWRVRALHSLDTSNWSVSWNFTVLDSLNLVSPTNGQGFLSPDALVDWAGVSGISGYQVQVDTSSGFGSALSSIFTTGTTSQYANSNLRFGTTYYWRVRTFHATDTSAWSVAWSFSTTDNINLVSPSNGQAFLNPDALVDWSGISGISGYQVQLDTSAGFGSTLASIFTIGATSQYANGNLLFGTTYYWRVRTFHSTDTSAWSVVWSFSTTDNLNLVSPTNGQGFLNPDALVDWSGISGVSGYQVQLDTSAAFGSPAGNLVNIVSTSQYPNSNLLFGTTYYWRVRTYHAADTSSWSVVWNFSTRDDVTLISPGNNSVFQPLNLTLDWSGFSGITGYQVYLDDDPQFGNPTLFTTGTTSQFSASNLSYGTVYWWKVRAFHATDTSGFSPAWNFQTVFQISSVPFLISPADFSVNQLLSDTLTWGDVNDPLVTEYDVEIDISSTFNQPFRITVTDTLYVYSGLSPNTTYFWRVRGANSSGKGAWSSTWRFSTVTGVGLNEQEFRSTAGIYPNPFSAGEQIRFKGLANGHYRVLVVNAAGQLTADVNFTNSGEALPLPLLPQGHYRLILLDRTGKTVHQEPLLITP